MMASVRLMPCVYRGRGYEECRVIGIGAGAGGLDGIEPRTGKLDSAGIMAPCGGKPLGNGAAIYDTSNTQICLGNQTTDIDGQ